MSSKHQKHAGQSSWAQAMQLLRRRHFSPWKTYVRRDLRLVVVLNAKVGSTTFRTTLVEGMKNADIAPMLASFWPFNETRRYMTALPGDYLHVIGHRELYSYRCFVRNPYARVLSAWNDKLVGGHRTGYARSMKRLIPKIRRFAAAHQLQGTDPSEVISFDTFLSFIESEPDGQRNQHWDTQSAVLLADVIDYDFVYKMETDLVRGMCEILQAAGIDREWVAATLNKPRNASGKIKGPVLNQQLADRIYALYENDFERFEYDRESWH